MRLIGPGGTSRQRFDPELSLRAALASRRPSQYAPSTRISQALLRGHPRLPGEEGHGVVFGPLVNPTP